MVLLAPARGARNDAEGTAYIEMCGINPWVVVLNLAVHDGRGVRAFHFRGVPPGYFEPTEWLPGSGDECIHKDRCDAPATGKFQYLNVSEGRHGLKSLSGNFEIELVDGRKLVGAFRVKGIRGPVLICE